MAKSKEVIDVEVVDTEVVAPEVVEVEEVVSPAGHPSRDFFSE